MAERINDLTGKEWLQNSFSIWRNITKDTEEKKLNHPASYPAELSEKLIRIWTREGANILDPFLGSGSTILGALNCNRRCTGIELSKEYCDMATERVESKFPKNKNYKIINGDSLKEIPKLNEEYDLTVTSPPYWDVLNMKRTADNKKAKNYSNSNNDLGNIDDYKEFIKMIESIFGEIIKKTKVGGYCIINVMDLRKKDIFYPLHMDIIEALRNVGWTLDDIIIWDRQSDYNNMKPLGYPYKYRINKVHEYLIIFNKRKEV
jgi:DNA modification methylase